MPTYDDELGDTVGEKRLRLLHCVVTPVFVWDDGEEMIPGPGINPIELNLRGLANFIEQLPELTEKVAVANPLEKTE